MSKMTSKTKRILAMCLAIIMAFSVMGIVVVAEDPKPAETTSTKSELVFTIKPPYDGADALQTKGVYVTGFTIKDTTTKTKDGTTETTVGYRLPVNTDMKPYLNVPEAWIVTIEDEIISSLTATAFKVVGIGVAEDGETQTIDYDKDGNPVTVESDKVVSFSNTKGNIIKCIYVPTSVKDIESNALAGCTSLALVSYKGTCAQWTKINNAGIWETIEVNGEDKKVWKENTFGGGLTNSQSIQLETAGGHVYERNDKVAMLTIDDTDYQTSHALNHKVLCDVCDDNTKRADHKWVKKGEPVYDFPCLSGVQTYSCACGEEKKESVAAKTQHEYTAWKEIPASQSNQTHDAELQHVRYCKICNSQQLANLETEYVSHRKIIIRHFANEGTPKNYSYPSVEAESGFCVHYEKVYCEDCGRTFAVPESTTHVWSDWEDNGDTKFFRSGTLTRTCKVCKDTQTKSYKQIAYTDANGDGKITDEDVTPFTKAFGNCYFGKIFGLPLGAVFFVANLVISGTETVGNWFVDMPSIVDFMKKIFH